MAEGGEFLHLFDPVIGLLHDGSFGRFGHDEMTLEISALTEMFEKANSVDDAGRSGHSDDKALFHHALDEAAVCRTLVHCLVNNETYPSGRRFR